MKLRFFSTHSALAKGAFALLAVASIVGLSSCGKGDSKRNTANIYLAGTEGTTPGETAVVWENGNKIYLTSGDAYSSANFITYKDGAFYVAGWEKRGTGKKKAVYWKDKTITALTDGTSDDAEATSLAFYGGDIYTVGNVGASTKAHYWKNTQDNTLTKDGKEEKVLSVSSNGSGVYAVGYKDDGNSASTGGKIYVARYWDITGNTNQDLRGSTQAYSVDTTKNTIAIAGYDQALTAKEGQTPKLQAVYWSAKKSGNGWGEFAMRTLTDGSTEAKANAVFVSNGKIFAGGYITDPVSIKKRAVYWKDDKPIYLTDGTTDAEVNSMFIVFGGDVYSAGYIKSSDASGAKKIPCYWINKKLVKIENAKDAQINSIIVR